MMKLVGRVVLILSMVFLSGCYLLPEVLLPTDSFVSTESATSELTSTPAPTSTPEPTATLTSVPTETPYILQPGTPAAISNFAHPDSGCEWLGVAGQVFDPEGLPILNLIVTVKGKLGEKDVDLFSMSGLEAGDAYGPGGYEIVLLNKPQVTTGSLKIQLLDLDADPLSESVVFETYQDCDRNLIIINFTAKNE